MKRDLSWFQILKYAAYDWLDDKAPQLGAALAYYTIFSIAPLLLIAIAIAGFVFGESQARNHALETINSAVGPQAAQVIKSMLESAAKPRSGQIATIIGITTLFFTALVVFTQLKSAMNTIWEISPKPSPGIWYYIRTYLFSFGMVLVIGFMLLVSLIISAVLTVVGNYFEKMLPGGSIIWQVANLTFSFAIITLLFALIYKFLPDAYIRWKDIWPGAIITSVLFTIGMFGLSLYISKGSMSSSYGAAGSLMVLLFWVYYSAQIMFFGAEITQVYANSHGMELKPKPYARMVRAQPPDKPSP